MKLLDIGEVSARSGVAASALRHYESIGLIASVARQGLRRQFPPETLWQLRLIAIAKMAGFTLDEINGMFGKNGLPEIPRPTFHQKADEIDDRIRELTLLSATLRHIADCPAPSHTECPKFQGLLDGTRRPQDG